MLNRRALALGLIGTLLCLPLLAQSQSDKDLLERIRKEEATNSQIMKTMHMFTDVYGPRLTGSPNHKAAAEWAVKQMTAWGLQNAHLEPWDFGHVGWLNERLTAMMTARVADVLPNGDLVVEGVREIDINGDRQIAVLTGVLRPRRMARRAPVAEGKLPGRPMANS